MHLQHRPPASYSDPKRARPRGRADSDAIEHERSAPRDHDTGIWRNFLSFNSYFNQTDDPQILEYKFIRSIGRGAHAEVYLVEQIEMKEYYAAKIYSKSFLYRNTLNHEQMINKVMRELEIMNMFAHRNIIHLKEVLDDDETNSVILILFYASHGSLLPRGSHSKPIPEARCQWIFAQVALALREVHNMNVVHRDIKPENILMHDDDRAVLSDFDLEILETHPVEYRCYCSRDRVTRALISMGREELSSLIQEQGQAELTCQFCDQIYRYSKEDLEEILANM